MTPSLLCDKSAGKSIAWHLVHTKPRQEQVALVNLQRQGYECYLPQWRVQKRSRGKLQQVTEPLFPRYLFIRLDSSDQGKSWAPVRSTLGVARLVRFGDRPAVVQDDLVALLRQREAAEPTQTLFSAGDSVVIQSGPLAGLEAVYQMPQGEQRALVLIEILSRRVSVVVEEALLGG